MYAFVYGDGGRLHGVPMRKENFVYLFFGDICLVGGGVIAVGLESHRGPFSGMALTYVLKASKAFSPSRRSPT